MVRLILKRRLQNYYVLCRDTWVALMVMKMVMVRDPDLR